MDNCSRSSIITDGADRLTNLPVECVLDIFEKFNIRDLSAVGDTCEKLLSIAQKSFILRREDSIINLSIERKTLEESNPSLYKNCLRQFGEFVQALYIYVSNESLSLLEHVVRYCNSLKCLMVESDLSIDHVIQLNMKSLFKHLKVLRITSSSYDMLNYPFDVCQQIVSLNIRKCDEKMVVNLLNHEYPLLRVLKMVQRNIPENIVDPFLLKHPNLLVVMIKQPGQQYSTLGTLAKIERLFLYEMSTDISQMIGKIALKHLSVTEFASREHFIEFLSSSQILHDNLELFNTILNVECDFGNDDILTNLLKFTKLRDLRIHTVTKINEISLIDILKQLIEGLPQIEILEISVFTDVALTENPIECNLIEGKISFTSQLYENTKTHLNRAQFIKNGIKKTFMDLKFSQHFWYRSHPCERETE